MRLQPVAPRARETNGAPPAHGYATLDALRAVAALAVLTYHVHQLFYLHGIYVRWARIGDAGVTVFFVLSGYLIAASVLRPAGSRCAAT